jgi:hypothetical protein
MTDIPENIDPNFVSEGLFVGDPAIEALGRHDAEFRLRQIGPALACNAIRIAPPTAWPRRPERGCIHCPYLQIGSTSAWWDGDSLYPLIVWVIEEESRRAVTRRPSLR